MRSFFVIINKNTNNTSKTVISESLESLKDSYFKVSFNEKFGVAIKTFISSKTNNISRGTRGDEHFLYDEKSSYCIITDSRIDYREELYEKIGLNSLIADNHSESRIILSAYLKWGKRCLNHLYGDFAFVIWNIEKDKVFCARDHFGCRPLYYYNHPDFFVFASNVDVFSQLPKFKLQIRDQYILDAICNVEENKSDSAFEKIFRLKPAHYLNQSLDELSEQYRYWNLEVNKDLLDISFENAVKGLKEKIYEAILQRCFGNDQIGIELSGGLDSSGIASVLVNILEKRDKIRFYTHSISSEGAFLQNYDRPEIKYSKEFLEEIGCLHQIIVNEEGHEGSYISLVNALTQMLKPINQSYSMNSDLLHKVAGNEGTRVMFSGLGGDEGITFSGAGYYNDLIKQGKYSQLLESFSYNQRRNSIIYCRVIKYYMKYYLPRIFKLLKKDWRRQRFFSFAIHNKLALKYKMKKRYFHVNSFPYKNEVRAIQYFRLMHPNIPNRLEETHLLAQKWGIEYRYPFLDVKLLEFFYSLPSEYKYMYGTGRYLYRKALEQVLPDSIRLRIDKAGNTIPNVIARILKDEKVFKKIIEEGRSNNQFHYVNYNKLSNMLETFKNIGEHHEWEFGPRAFLSPISVLILQKWQREGKIDIGIKC